METNINYTLVGAFVISIIAAIVIAIIWLSSGFTLENFSTYMFYSTESVSGLSIDSPVEFNGVNVGTVKSVDLNESNPQLVEVLISVKGDTPVSQGTIATLTTRGVTGITYVSLKDKSSDLRPLVRTPGDPYPVIKTGPSLFTRIDTTLSELSTNLKEVTQSVQSVLNKDNQTAIHAILANLVSVTTVLDENSHKMAILLKNTAHASEQLTPLMQASIGTVRTLQGQTLPEAYRLLYSLNQVTRNINEVTTQIKQNPSVLIRGASIQQPGPGETR